MHAHVHADQLVAADALEARSWSARSSFTCSSGGMSPISSKKTVPAVGQLELAQAPLLGVGERALLVAEQLATPAGWPGSRRPRCPRRAARRAGCSGGARAPPPPCRCRTRRAAARDVARRHPADGLVDLLHASGAGRPARRTPRPP